MVQYSNIVLKILLFFLMIQVIIAVEVHPFEYYLSCIKNCWNTYMFSAEMTDVIWTTYHGCIDTCEMKLQGQ